MRTRIASWLSRRFPGATRTDAIILIATIVLALVYVGNAVTPSSYALALQHIGVESDQTGLILGSPRAIRSDEWAHMTPWIRATVISGFKRYNESSPFREDFRAIYGMPVLDWGLAFKPSMWMFPILDAGRAYSFHFFFHSAAFVLGYLYLLITLGVRSRAAALGGATILYFSGFVQGWWTVNAAAMSFVPWAALALLHIANPWLKSAALYWLVASSAISLMYPPFLLMAGLFCLAIVVARLRQTIPDLRTFILLGVALLAAVMTGYGYLHDEINAVRATVYPGGRPTADSGNLGWQQFAMHLFPTLYVQNFESLLRRNLCEIGVIGSLINVAALCFLDYRGLRAKLFTDVQARHLYLVFLVGFVYLAIWQLVAVPAWWSNLTGIGLVTVNRSTYLSGLFLTVLSIHACCTVGLRVTVLRSVLFAALLVYPVGWTKLVTFEIPARAIWLDLIVIPACFALAALVFVSARVIQRQRGRTLAPQLGSTALVCAAAFAGIVSWAPLNPLQSGTAIFERHITPVTAALDRHTIEQGGRELVVPMRWGFSGAVLMGLGYPSVTTATFRPSLPYWRQKFPDLAEKRFQNLFNRTAHFIVDDLAREPQLLRVGLVVVPALSFVDERIVRAWGDHPLSGVRKAVPARVPPVRQARLGGHIDVVNVTEHGVDWIGWSPWGLPKEGEALVVVAPGWAGSMPGDLPLALIQREDVARVTGSRDARWSGFRVVVKLPLNQWTSGGVCLMASDGANYHVLAGGDGSWNNRAGCEALGVEISESR